jgi:Nucleotidyltransferase
MSTTGDADLLVAARGALLDALEALRAHLDSVIVIGAQAIYMHTGAAPVALAEATKDSDLALDARRLTDQPLLEETMRAAGFHLDTRTRQPGAWLSAQGIPVDLMVPEALSGASGRRGARIASHSKNAARRAIGLEAAVVDHAPMEIQAMAASDDRVFMANVAGPAALLVAKLHKLSERKAAPGRLMDKDAHDIYRLLVAIPIDELAARLQQLRIDELAGPVTKGALTFLAELFAAGADALGSMMAGRAEEGVGEPQVVAASAAFLAEDLLAAVGQA